MNTELNISATLGSILSNTAAVDTLMGMMNDLGLEISGISTQQQ